MSSHKNINVFDTILALIISISISSVLLLSLHRFNSLISIILGIILFLIFYKTFNLKIAGDGRLSIGIILILLVALFFRPKPYAYVVGAGDTGLYVNMSSYYEEKGSTFITDEVRERLTDSQKQFYDRENHHKIYLRRVGEYEGMHIPGIYIKKLGKSEYVFQLYPLHPIWMAMCARIFGDTNRIYSLIFFSLISITGLYLIALEMSNGDRYPAYLVAFFLAVNPAHVYFSKYPVAEVVFLAFSSTSFYYLIRYYRDSTREEIRPEYLILSAGLAFCLFFTKINGFMYMPFYYFLFLVTILYMEKGVVRKHLLLYFLAVFAFFCLSVMYGMEYSYPYSSYIYRKAFERFFGENWRYSLTVLVSSALLLAVLLGWCREKLPSTLVHKVAALFHNNIDRLLYAAIILGMYTAYQFAFTRKYVGRSSRFPLLPALGWESVQYTNIISVLSYMSPFAFILFLFAISHYRKRRNFPVNVLMLFLAAFWIYGTVLRFQTPFQFYWIRYLLAELLPYSALLVLLYVGDVRRHTKVPRYLTNLFIGLIMIYPSYFTCRLFINEISVNVGANSSLEKIASHLDRKDLLILCKEDDFGLGMGRLRHGKLKTPLFVYYQLNVFDISRIDKIFVKDMVDIVSSPDYEDVFVLSRKRIERDFLVPIEGVAYKFGRTTESSTFPPTEFMYMGTDLFLHRVEKSVLLSAYAERDGNSPLQYPEDNAPDSDANPSWTTDNLLIE